MDSYKKLDNPSGGVNVDLLEKLNNHINSHRCKVFIKLKKMEEIKSKSYTLKSENGDWLGQVVLTSDGMFASVTDWGNLSYSWRSFGDDFREFILSLNTQYLGTKLYTGMSYILYGKKCEAACNKFAEKILPALQKELREEIERGESFLS